jgi:CheY-like chemotaxis protein
MPGALDAIFPGIQKLVLCRLFSEPDRWWTAGGLAAKVAAPGRSVRRLLLLLVRAGVARARREGTRTFYQPDPGCPVYAELHSLIGKLAAAAASATILIVEDQEATAQITRILLESWGYRVLEAHSGRRALEIFDERRGEVSLLLADVVMPEMSGPELAKRLSGSKPELRVVLMSGAPYEADGRIAFLPKPFNPTSLARAVRRQLEQIKTA